MPIVMSMSGMSVCVCDCLGTHSPSLHQIFGSCLWPMAVAQSSYGGVAIRYVLPVLWMTSCFPIVAPRHIVGM